MHNIILYFVSQLNKKNTLSISEIFITLPNFFLEPNKELQIKL